MNEVKTVELEVEKEQPKDEKKQDSVTRESLKEKGWSAAELDAAEKRGMIAKPEEKKKEGEPAKKEELTLPKKEEEQKGKEPEKGGSFLDAMDKELTPAQEKMFLEMFPPGTKPRAFYYRAKNERHSRQRAEAERDRLALELQTRKDEDARSRARVEEEVDEDGNPIDPEDKPLTMKQLKLLQKQENEAADKYKRDLNERGTKVSEALETQEEFAKEIYPDFEETVKLAKDLVENIDKVSNPTKRAKVTKLWKDLHVAAAQADTFNVDDYTASMIAYELGQMHEKYGQKAEEKGDGAKEEKDPKANGGLTPEQMKRIEENTQRRTSSASLPGTDGGTRQVSVSDVTVKDLLKMTPEKRFKFKKDHPERYDKLMRG